MSAPVLKIDRLSWDYVPGHPVLHQISLTVEAGERVAIIGPNGAGKTTLLKCLNGLLRPQQGQVFIMDKPAPAYAARQLARTVAYVPQPMNSGLPFPVRDFIMMGRYPHWSTLSHVSAADREAVGQALEITGTTHLATRIHATLSGGERQKVMLAAALAQQAPILLLDEPSAFLDPGHQYDIDCILLAVNRRDGVTIVTATHDLNRAALTHDRIVGLRDGSVICDAVPAAVLQPDVLQQLYRTSFVMVQHPDSDAAMILPRSPQEPAP